MTNRTAAHRYARALFDVAITEKGDLQQIEADLAGFVDLLAANPLFEKVLLNPAVPVPRKRAAVEQVNRLAGLSTIVAKLLTLLADRDRLVILPDVLASYRERLLDHQKVVRAEITSAAPLSPERLRAIEVSLANVTGKRVTLTTRIDPAIIGGMVARVGGTVYDASITRQLEKMRQRMEARG